MKISRRAVLRSSGASAFAAVFPRALTAETPIELNWEDLVPDEGGTALKALRALGIVQHGQLSTPWDQETGGVVTNEYDGLTIRIPGYLVPLEFDGSAVSSALLVPYVGACIHVPPPPPNQLIFVTTQTPYESDGLFEPVYVTGTFGTGATETQLAEVGYAIGDAQIEPYG